MADEIKAAVAAVVQGMIGLSSWIFILSSYANQQDIPTVVWTVAIAVLAKYGIDIVGPTATKLIKESWQKGAPNGGKT